MQDASLAWISFNELGWHFKSRTEDSSARGSSDRVYGKNSLLRKAGRLFKFKAYRKTFSKKYREKIS